ncbi:serine hydrolase domain-containing protein [Phenylobacterium sp.]|uniref:serine hydrolase domain-containing protein n=1 Tax=Phenylobacterium sp. TaxID=1871053 RepID=UPI00374C95F8
MRLSLAAWMLAAAIALPACAQPAADPVVGLWRYQERSDPALHGALALTHSGKAWRASLGGREAVGEKTGSELRFDFPQGLGQLRVRLAGHAAQGYWRQPAGDIGPPQTYATPVALKATANGWRGEVRPLATIFTLYLKVFRDADGSLVGAFRNPEFNLNHGRTQFLVSHDGEVVHFTSRPAQGQSPSRFDARLAEGGLRIDWPGFNHPLDLRPAVGAEAQAFYPRPPGGPRYAYRPPPRLADGWATAKASTTGLDEAALTRIVQTQIDTDPAALRPQLMQSILVAHRGKLVLEEYFYGYDRTTRHDVRSGGKTYASVMLGAVMMRDSGIGPDSRIYDLMKGRGPFANPDPRKAEITLAHLMTRTSGLACNDNDEASPGNEETMQSQAGQPDWWKYTLDLPMAHDPGTRYAYCSANPNLVGGALTARTGTWLPELFDRTVARPLQFGTYSWDLMPTGEGYQGGGAYILPRDYLKIGQAYLDGGVWHGRRIVSADWARRSTAIHQAVSPTTTGYSPEEFQNFYVLGQDGYAWHISRLKVGDRVFQDYEATGNGGQVLIVVPEADLVVAFTGGNYGQGGIWNRWKDQIVAQQIIPAIRP